MHHPVFTNKVARVLDVIALPGDTSLIHQHANNYCYITVKGGTVWLESPGEKERVVKLPVGFIGGYYENPAVPLVHRFANLSADTIRLIAIENLSQIGDPLDSLVDIGDNEEILINNSYFILSKIFIASNTSSFIHTHRPAAIVNVESKSLLLKTKKDTESLKHWVWLDANKTATILNTEADSAMVVLVQLKTGKSNPRK